MPDASLVLTLAATFIPFPAFSMSVEIPSCSLWQNSWTRTTSRDLTGLHGQNRSNNIVE